MTRLTTEMIMDTGINLQSYNDLIKKQTGLDLFELGCEAAGKNKNSLLSQIEQFNIAVVPITAGLGEISKFSETVTMILRFVGFKSQITNRYDIAGIGEAYAEKADLIFAADDDEFISINTKCGKVVFNYAATAKAFVTALNLAVNGVKGKEVLIIGAGKVGQVAIEEFLQKEAKVSIYDIDKSRLVKLEKKYDLQIIDSLAQVDEKFNLIFDASPATNVILENMVSNDTVISCPGVPHGLEPKALGKIHGNNLIHDNLVLGVITMAIEAL